MVTSIKFPCMFDVDWSMVRNKMILYAKNRYFGLLLDAYYVMKGE